MTIQGKRLHFSDTRSFPVISKQETTMLGENPKRSSTTKREIMEIESDHNLEHEI